MKNVGRRHAIDLTTLESVQIAAKSGLVKICADGTIAAELGVDHENGRSSGPIIRCHGTVGAWTKLYFVSRSASLLVKTGRMTSARRSPLGSLKRPNRRKNLPVQLRFKASASID
jgi:hypothetical protein